MKNYSISREKVFFLDKTLQDIFLEEKLVLIDGGAAGGISAPFDVAENHVKAVRFEPRGKETVSIESSDIFIDGGIWSEDVELPLHIATGASASSICKPNKAFLEGYDDRYGWPLRKTARIVDVKLRSIDSVVKNGEAPEPHFIKLDIHSAELPALKGALHSLGRCIGVLVESWHSEVHLQQGLHCEVEKLLIDNGFTVYDNVCASRWRHKHANNISPADRPQYIGSEMLFIRESIPKDLAIKKIMILSLFGFGNAAKQVAEEHSDYLGKEKITRIIDTISKYQERKLRSPRKLMAKVFRKISTLLEK
ncbi:MAG: FkbM family methyltransferase [Pseudohongiellaceae bacterium]|nr:FkbM family methyltransferase [Pseudohongiellaceae bacterium]